MVENKKITDNAIELMKSGYICDNCLGRQFAELLSGMSNAQRGKIVRHYVAFIIDSGENTDVDTSNFHDMKFRNVTLKTKQPENCTVCKNFFLERIDKLTNDIAEKLSGYEFDTFLIGTVLSGDLFRAEEELWERTGIEFVEPIKSEMNRELGKRVEKTIKQKVDMTRPDITVIVDMSRDEIRLQIRSVFVYGKYSKLVRGIPQSRWDCIECRGKGCMKCAGEGKLYKTSVQEIIEKPMIPAAKAKKSKFHGAGREDIDARCLGKRPFIIELVRPKRRKINLRKLQAEINKSKRVKVSGLKIAEKKDIEPVKNARYDKTYEAEVVFSKKIDKQKLKLLKQLNGLTIMQKTPQRVAHRRANLTRKRGVRKLTLKLVGERKMIVKIRGEAGLYIKELLSGDDGRTQPNVADMLGNKVKNIKLDVIKIHTGKK